MPLHLLSKKSWNVYAPENIARVKRDQAEAQAREEEDDRRLQEHDSARRLAVLRGEFDPSSAQDRETEVHAARSERERGHRDDRRKRKRLHGEDDTDRDLRIAREDMSDKHRRSGHGAERRHNMRSSHAPITDRDGHINLFPPDEYIDAKDQKNVGAEREKARKQRELEDQYTMRFSNAAGRNAPSAGPWYAADKRANRENMDFVEGKDVWGKPDPSAQSREQARQISSDPFAFMQRVQTQLKQAERDKARWQEEEQGASRHDRHRHRHRRERSRSRDGHQRRHHHHGHSSRTSTRPSHRSRDESGGRSSADKKQSGRRNGSQNQDALPAIVDDFSLNS